MIRRFLILSVLLVSAAATAPAQAPERTGRTLPREVFCEAHLVPAENMESSVLVLMRTYPNVFSFTNDIGDGKYRAMYSMTMECLDSTGVIRCSQTKQDSVVVPGFAQTRSFDPRITSGDVCKVPASIVKVRVILEQRGMTLFKWTSAELRMTSSKRREVFTSPILCSGASAEGLTPSVFGGKIPFSDRPVVVATHVSGVAEDEVWTWTCAREVSSATLIPTPVTVMSGRCSVLVDRAVDVSRLVRTADSVTLGIGPDGSHLAVAVIRADIPASLFSPGSYRFTLRCESTGDSIVTQLPCIWPSMPQTFRNESLMLMVMRYLLTESEFENVSDGDESEIRTAVVQWWKKLDPRPSTPFNQALNACFSRADDATTLYQTAIEPNGIRTERGRVYILYGPPDTVTSERSSADTQRETWTYTQRLRQKIVFDIDERGVYRVKSVDKRE